jgi:DNA polymerase
MTARKATESGRRLLGRYLHQLAEAGETEIYLAPDAARALGGGLASQASANGSSASDRRDAAPGRGSASRSEAREDAPPVGDPPRSGQRAGAAKPAAFAKAPAGRARQPAADPEPPPAEIVEVDLSALEATRPSPDMFAEPSPLDGCGSLAELESIAFDCGRCELAGGRTKVVFGVGDPSARLMFVGEAPGRDEDLQGIPFVGRAGQLLDRILEAASIDRDSVYIGNIIKCRPPNNRTPLTSEIEACIPYLVKQIELIEPRVICTLGLPATQTLLGIRGSMGSLRGKIYRSRKLQIIPTYHPAAALRDPKYKRPLWDDILLVKREYERRDS